MGYGKKLKAILDKKKISIRQLAHESGIAPTTLYSIVQRDTDIRYDFALKISNVLSIPVASICEDLPYGTDSDSDHTDNSFDERGLAYYKKMYLSDRSLKIAELFNQEDIPVLDKLISEYYVLDDEARDEILKIIKIKHANHDDDQRVKNIKNLK